MGSVQATSLVADSPDGFWRRQPRQYSSHVREAMLFDRAERFHHGRSFEELLAANPHRFDTAADLARRLGIHPVALTRCRHGRYVPRTWVINLIAQGLKLSPATVRRCIKESVRRAQAGEPQNKDATLITNALARSP